MSVSPGQALELLVERPVSGGRMIARHEGEVILVAGAIPGERVAARVTRAEKRVAFAETTSVLEPSADRRPAADDASCGGCVYAFIDYPRQRALKGEIIRDAFTRIGRIPLEAAVEVAASPERGYRMRARFHVSDGRPGFYREGSHTLCDPRLTGQLEEASVDAVEAAIASLTAQGLDVMSAELSENMTGDQRAIHVDVRGAQPTADALERAIAAAGLTGCTARSSDRRFHSAGDPVVSDPLSTLLGEPVAGGLFRHPEAFFQANRYLIAPLTRHVIARVDEGPVVDLYAGVGLFAVGLAAAGRDRIVAVEGDPIGAKDLVRNAAAYGDQLRVVRGSVEAWLAHGRHAAPRTIIVDPPRTGMSREAADAIVRIGAQRVVYVSCDAPTMARDARRLLDDGYRLEGLAGFDLFPNTPHVETVGVFER